MANQVPVSRTHARWHELDATLAQARRSCDDLRGDLDTQRQESETRVYGCGVYTTNGIKLLPHYKP